MQKLYNLPFIKAIIFANVFISIAALAQVLVTYLVFPIPINFENNSYILFVLLSTFLQYNIQRGYMLQQQHAHNERSQWLAHYKKILLIAVGISLLTVVFLCNTLSYTSIGIMVGAELLSTLYYLPPFNIRKYGYIKPFLISFIWIFSCIMVPLIENNLLTLNSIWFMVSQFFFIAALCVLFDIKDAEEDYLNGVNTYANKYGVRATRVICAVLVVLSTMSVLFFKHQSLPTLKFSAFIGTLTIILCVLSNEKRHSFFYYLWVDGLLIAQALLIWAIAK